MLLWYHSSVQEPPGHCQSAAHISVAGMGHQVERLWPPRRLHLVNWEPISPQLPSERKNTQSSHSLRATGDHMKNCQKEILVVLSWDARYKPGISLMIFRGWNPPLNSLVWLYVPPLLFLSSLWRDYRWESFWNRPADVKNHPCWFRSVQRPSRAVSFGGWG